MSGRFEGTLTKLGLTLVACQCNVLHEPCDTCAAAIENRDRILGRLAQTRWLDYHRPGGASTI